MKDNLKVVCFGEILFDVFQGNKKIGGAPLNVASRIKSFGGDISIISAVGKDTNGEKLLEYIEDIEIDTNSIQVKEDYPTGLVNLTLDEKGDATYDINYPSAWDKIDITKEITSLVMESDYFIHGSLVSRDIVSRHTLYELLKVAKYKIFDVNLRFPHYSWETILDLMETSNFVKFNEEEIHEVLEFLNQKFESLEESIKYVSEATKTDAICVTLGEDGAILFYKNQFYYNKGYTVNVVDTIGSGDSFLASLIVQLFTKNDPQRALDFACAVGAIVAQSEGANPKITSESILNVINNK